MTARTFPFLGVKLDYHNRRGEPLPRVECAIPARLGYLQGAKPRWVALADDGSPYAVMTAEKAHVFNSEASLHCVAHWIAELFLGERARKTIFVEPA